MKYTDPTGHCAINNTECWEYLVGYFCAGGLCGDTDWSAWVIVDASSIWTTRQLQLLRETLVVARQAMQGIGISDWIGAFGGVRFRHRETDRSVDHGVAEFRPSSNQIALRSGWGNTSHAIGDLSLGDNAIRTALHEMGHALDHHSSIEHRDMRLSSYLPHTRGSSFVGTKSGYYYREYGYIEKDTIPQEGFADAFAAWAWYSARGTHLGVQRDTEIATNWGLIYSLMVSLLED